MEMPKDWNRDVSVKEQFYPDISLDLQLAKTSSLDEQIAILQLNIENNRNATAYFLKRIAVIKELPYVDTELVGIYERCQKLVEKNVHIDELYKKSIVISVEELPPETFVDFEDTEEEDDEKIKKIVVTSLKPKDPRDTELLHTLSVQRDEVSQELESLAEYIGHQYPEEYAMVKKEFLAVRNTNN